MTPLAVFRRLLGLCALLHLAGCMPGGGVWSTGRLDAEGTYQRFLMRAESGDAESQNIVGYMLYHGEGVPADRARAEVWFRLAAEQGNVRAQRNLAALAASDGRRPVLEASPPAAGEAGYLRYCSGCHGFNGIAAYEHSPSFALGQALEKSDAQLMRSLLQGKGEMPNWDDKLPRTELEDILKFIRTLRLRYEAGIAQPLREPPGYYYKFGPMNARPVLATDPDR